jgi:hypothetical protein
MCLPAGARENPVCWGERLLRGDFFAGFPQVIIDPIGAAIDNFLDKVTRFLQYIPASERDLFWNRIIYVDMSGKGGSITPFPLYYKLGTERSLLECAEQYLQTIIRKATLTCSMLQCWAGRHCIGLGCTPAWCCQPWATRSPRLRISCDGQSSG